MLRLSPRSRLVSFLLVLPLLIGCAADDSPDATPTAEGTTAVAPEATATAPPPPGTALTPQAGASTQLSEARRLEAEGDLEAAANAYVAVAARGGAERGAATLGAARVLLELERPADVRILLEPFVASATGDDLASRYLLARAYAALELWPQSLEQYDLYIRADRYGLAYAYYDRGNVLLQLQRPLEAVTSYQNGLNLGLPGSTRRSYLLAIAQAYERAGETAQAMAAYRNLIDGSDLPGDDALALRRIAAMKRDLGDGSYRDDLNRLFGAYPTTSEALAELEAALARGEAIDPVLRGLVFYRHNDYTRAEAPFREQIAAAPDAPASAEAYYFLGAIIESRGDANGAAAMYARVPVLNPASGIADDALWWRGRIMEDEGKQDEARALYARIINEYPQSSWAPDAAFRRGMLPYRADAFNDAAAIWGEGAAAVPGDRERLLLWQAKALLKAKNESAARPILEGLASANEDDYYGIRARSLLGGKQDQYKTALEEADLTPTFDWSAAEAWLVQRTGLPITPTAWNGDKRWLRAQELWLVGRSSQGDAEAFDLIESLAGNAIAMYTLSRELLREGRVGMSGRAGQRLLRVLNTNPNAGLPKALLSLSYPPAFGALAQRYAEAEDISPLLLLAFVRQESFFDPRAVSPAGALGLTQVLPSTGRSLAQRLGVGDFGEEMLLQADANLRFGARYMKEQLGSFGGEIFVAFAAYNAGPNAARRWRGAEGAKDADVFLETVEYRETRLYVEFVAENYAIYRYLYGGEAEPNLPD